ncbi:MAG: GTP-binding protein [Candidatus Helarchaeota archaeon]|nr:GTP-binding protein [Candidatus Helarchaeota archaeon]
MPTLHYKVVVVGDGAVGKTTLILRYTEKRFRESYIPTIGVQWVVKTVDLGETNVKLILWDIAGQEKFKVMRSNFYDGADAVIIVFDVTNLISFDHVENWLKEVQKFCGNVPYILLGNKIDLVEERKISPEIAESFTRKYDLPYFETSAKTGKNVIDMFKAVIEKTRQFETADMEMPAEPSEIIEERKISLSDELEILEEMIKNDEKIYMINQEFRTITNEIFKQNPYHEKLEEMAQFRLEKLIPYRDDANLTPSDKEIFIEKIQKWKSVVV